MEIEVGDYVRTNSGLIFKVNEITYDEEYKDYLYKESFLLVDWKENIVKHSKQLIDLVEVGDYVNGHLVVEISKNAYNQKIVITEVDGKDGAIRHHYLERSIKNVVTHEQFESIEYKVEEDK